MSQLSQTLANQYFKNGLSPLAIYKNGFIINISTLITAGYSLSDLKVLGLSKSKFDSAGYSITNLKTAGYTALILKTAGYSINDLKTAGFSASELKAAVFSLSDLKSAGFSAGELTTAEYTVSDLIGAGFQLSQLKNIGYLKNDFLTASYTATSLRSAGFTPADLKTAEYIVTDLINAGFQLIDLKNIGFVKTDFTTANKSVDMLISAGFSTEDLKTTEYNVTDLSSIYTPIQLKNAGYTAGEFRVAGYSISDLLAIEFIINELNNAGFTKTDFLNANPIYTATYLKNTAEFSARNLKVIGFTIQELLDAGFSLYDLRNVGFVKDDFDDLLYGLVYLYQVGYTLYDLLKIGYNLIDLYGLFRKEQFYSVNITVKDFLQTDIGGLIYVFIEFLGYTPEEIVNGGMTKTYIDYVDEGSTVADLKSYNFTASNLRVAGYSVSDLLTDFSLTELIGSGYTKADFNSANISITELINAEFSISDLKTAGYTALELNNQAGISIINLKTAGYTALELKTAGFYISDIFNAGFQLIELNFNEYTISDFNTISKTATDLKNAGYSAYNLKMAGYSVIDLKTAGYLVSEFIYEDTTLLYSVSELLNGNYSLTEIKNIISFLKKINFDYAYVSVSNLKTAEYTISELISLGYIISDLKNGGFTAMEFKASGYKMSDLKTAGFSTIDLKTEGFSISDILNSGFQLIELNGIGYTRIDFLSQNINATDLKLAGFSIIDLKTAGFSITDLKLAGFSASELKSANFTIVELKAANFTASELKVAEYTANELKMAGFSITDLKAAGYTASELKSAGFSITDLKTAGFSITDLKTAGYTASDLKTAGFSVSELKEAGYTAFDLKTVGFSITDLKTAGFSITDLKTAGYTASDFKTAGFSVSELKDAGYTASDLKIAGYTASDLKTAGFTLIDLLNAGFQLIQLNNLGYVKTDFNLANITILKLKSAGYTATDLRKAGYTATDLKNAGFIITDLITAGFTLQDLKNAGYSGIELRNLGYYTIHELKDVGYTTYELINSQYEMNNYLRDKQFLQKLCNTGTGISRTTDGTSSDEATTCNITVINTIKAKDSSQTQSSKFSNYVQRGKFMKIYEGKIKEITMIFATPTTATIVFVPVGYIKTVTFIAKNVSESDSDSGSTMSSPYTFQNLTPNSTYDVTSIVTYSSGNTYTEIFTRVIKTLNEGPPTNVRISNITNKTAYITFIKPIGIPSDVIITVTNQNDSKDTQYIPNLTTNNDYLITNLQINNSYTFLMTSIYIKTKNKYSITFPFATLNEDFPTNILFTDINNISANISYNYTGTPLYNSIFVVNNANPVESYTQKTLETTTTFVLKNDVTYNVTVTSVYTSGNSFPVENNNAIYILNEGPPTGINIQYIKGTSIFFSFVNAIGNPYHYELLLSYLPRNQIIHIFDVNNTQNILIEDLTPNTTYTFQLKSSYLQTGNVYTYVTNFQTLNEGIIRDFVLDRIGNSFITFSFTYPPGENYNIAVILNNALDFKTININTNNYTANGLLINAAYSLSITTTYIKSNTTYTYNYPATIYTLNEGPSIVNYDLNNTTDQSIYLEFSNPYYIPNKYIFVSTNENISTDIITTEYTISNSQIGNILITGLLPNSKYKTVLNTYYTQNIYPSSPIIEVFTKGSPTNVQINEFITDTTASITFVAPIVVPTKYVLNTNNTTLNITTDQIQNNGITISGLTPNTYYDMSFGAYYEDIQKLYMQSFFTLTTKGGVQNILVTTITDTSATLLFNSPLLSYNWIYNVYLYSSANMKNIKSILNTSNTVFIFEDLSKNTSYKVDIEAIYQTQAFWNNITFSTKSFPYNLSISNVLDTQITLNWENLLNTPTYYNLIYYPPTISVRAFFDDVNIQEGVYNTEIIYPTDVITNTQTQISSYNIIGLIPDISYTILELSAYYSDINTDYINTNVDLPSIFMKSPPTNIIGYNQTNTTMTISFIKPLNTIPTGYSISAVNTKTEVKTDFSVTVTTSQDNNPIIYGLTDLSDNTNYDIFVNSLYEDDSITIIKSSPYNISTLGTPNIVSFTNIYTDRFTINIETLLIPTNCIFTYYNIRTKQTSTTSGVFIYDNSYGQYITPSIFFINDTYTVSIQSIYPNDISYTSITKQVSTSSPPILLSYISTDVSAIVYFIAPLNPPNSYNYTTTNANNKTVNTISNYFIVDSLEPSTINNIILYSYYSDNNQNYGSDSMTIYTKGPPTELTINPNEVFNTYLNLSFTSTFQCSKYTIHAISEKTSISKTLLQTPLFTRNTINYTLSGGLLEDTSYNIYVTSNYDNFNGNSSSLEIHTYKAIQIESIQNITDVSAIVIVNTRPSILPTDISFSYTADNINYVMDIDTVYNSSTESSYYIFKIEGLTPNTKYDPFTINSYYTQDNVTFVSENKPFSTKGITNINMYVTDISATISFPIPHSLPSNYYYVLDNSEPFDFTQYINTINGRVQYIIPNLPPNTLYSHFTIQTKYSDVSGTYISQDMSFCTKMIPYPIVVIGDTQIDISFTTIKSPYVQGYSYSLDQYTYDFQDVSFSPVDINGTISLTISGLIPNTFYNTFRINVLYSDIDKIYSSTNYAFNTMGSPIGAILSSPTVNNLATLSFYPPLYPPDYYIITNTNNPNTIIYANDISYINNVYSYQINNVSTVKDVNISSYYSNLNKTIPVNILISSTVLTNNTISWIETDYTGQYIKLKTATPPIFYYSKDYGKSWSNIIFDAGITTNNSNKSAVYDGKYVVTNTISNDGLNFSNDGGITYNYLVSAYIPGGLTTPPQMQIQYNNPIISGNGLYIYAYNNTQVYSYAIPVKKGSAYNLSVSNIKDKSVFFSFLQPSFIPDLSYDIFVTNHYKPSEKHVYKTSQNQNVILEGLTPNALYDISLNTNYSKEVQTFSIGLTEAFNTKSAPVNLNIIGNPTNTSAIIQFIEPFVKPTSYILQINDTSYNIELDQFSKINVKGVDINYDLQPNDISINTYTIQGLSTNNYYNVTLSSKYDNNNLFLFVSNDISFNTRGIPSNAVFTNIYDTSVNISFTLPKNTNDISGYTIQLINTNTNNPYNYITKTNKSIIYELSANTIYNIKYSTTYLNPLQTLTSPIYNNVLYTKGGPIIDVSYLSITDTSAIIQIVSRPPSIINNNSLFSKYQLGINDVYRTTDIRVLSSDISYILVTDLSQNLNNRITIKTFYTDTSATFISNLIYVPTQGYPANIRSDYNYITNNSAKITFDAAYNPPPKGYIVKIYSSSNPNPNDNNFLSRDEIYDTSINLTFPTANPINIYSIFVGSKYSDTKIFYNTNPRATFNFAGPPTDVSFIPASITDTSVNILFKTTTLNPLKYTIIVKQTDTNLITNIYDISSNYSNSSYYPLTNLPKNKNLSITYQSVYPNITLTSDKNYTFATVGPPRNIKFMEYSITDTSAVLTFNPPLNPPSSYNTVLKNINTMQTITTNILSSPYKLEGLTSNSTYELYLQAYYSNGVVSNSNIIGFSTQGIVSSVQINDVKDTQCTVSYQQCPLTPTSYDFTISGEVVPINKTYLNITNPYTVTDLSNNTIYHSKILSKYDSNWNVLF